MSLFLSRKRLLVIKVKAIQAAQRRIDVRWREVMERQSNMFDNYKE